jgi:hypothetical protein
MVAEGKLEHAASVLEELVRKYPASAAARSKAPLLLIELLKRMTSSSSEDESARAAIGREQ